MPVPSLSTEAERRTSAVYNELLPRTRGRDGLVVRLDGPHGSRIVWSIGDPVDGEGWSSERVRTIERLLPHLRQFVRVRQALAGAGALGASLADLLDNVRAGVIQLDRRGRPVAVNDRARALLRKGDGLRDEDGRLRAALPREDAALQKLLARALPPPGGPGEGGSMPLSCSGTRSRLVLHVTLLKHLVRRIRRHWPRTRLTFRGDSHYGRTEAMAWCEENGVDYIFGLAGNRALHRLAYDVADDLKVRRAEAGADRMRGFASFDYAAGSWRRKTPRRRPAGGDDPRLRRPLHRHLAHGRAAPSLRRGLLRPRPGREPHQAAQGPARLRPDLMPEPARQPVPPRPAHRGLLADARPARCRASKDDARLGRVRHPQAAPAQDRRARRREGRPDPHPLCLGLSRRRPVPHAGRAPRGLGTLTAGATCPANPDPFNPEPRHR